DRLAGKAAIITGAGSGFGEGMARRFAQEGCQVLVVDLDLASAEKVASETGQLATPFRADVSSSDDVSSMVEAAISRLGKIDILVNNAGYSHRNGSLLNVTEDEFDRIADVNMKAIYLATKAIVPHMRANGGGSILTTASTAGLRPRPGLTWYNASKGWTITATKSMAVELAEHNIRVNCLCPVAGETGMLATFMGEDTPEIRAKFQSVIPLGRFSTPLDIANAALWLVSDEAEFITGVALEVDGGRCV
ncbi:MAG: glucose 1-dehydrogenase, partial [Pseudomonadota bacterium]